MKEKILFVRIAFFCVESTDAYVLRRSKPWRLQLTLSPWRCAWSRKTGNMIKTLARQCCGKPSRVCRGSSARGIHFASSHMTRNEEPSVLFKVRFLGVSLCCRHVPKIFLFWCTGFDTSHRRVLTTQGIHSLQTS